MPGPGAHDCENPANDIRVGSHLMWVHRRVDLPCESGLPCDQRCGDLRCDGTYEDASSCPSDCAASCGDGTCANGEDPALCPQDCGFCGDDVCDPALYGTAAATDLDGSAGPVADRAAGAGERIEEGRLADVRRAGEHDDRGSRGGLQPRAVVVAGRRPQRPGDLRGRAHHPWVASVGCASTVCTESTTSSFVWNFNSLISWFP